MSGKNVNELGESSEDRQTRGRDVGALFARAAIRQLLSIGRQFVVLPLLGPGDVGLFRFLGTIGGQLNHLSFGGNHAHLLSYPQRAGAGDDDGAAAVQRVAWQAATIGGLISAAVTFLVVQSTVLAGRPIAFALAALALFPLIEQFASTSWTVRREFQTLARIDAAVSIAAFVAVVAATYQFGVEGLLVTAAIAAPLRAAAGWRFLFPKQWMRIDWRLLRRELGFGIRAWAAGITRSLAAGADVLLLGVLLGESSSNFGLYALGVMVVNAVGVQMTAVSQVQTIELTQFYGETGRHDLPAMTSRVVAAMLRDVAVSLVLAITVAALASVLIATVAPQHSGAMLFLYLLLPTAILQRTLKYPSLVLALRDVNRFGVGAALLSLTVTCATIGVIYATDAAIHWYVLAPIAGRATNLFLHLWFALDALATPGARSTGPTLRLSISLAPMLLYPPLALLLAGDSDQHLWTAAGALLLSAATLEVTSPGTWRDAASLLIHALPKPLASLFGLQRKNDQPRT